MKTPEKILKFYHSKKWKRARRLKVQTARGVCEECGKAGNEVHHTIPLTLANVDDDNIAIAQDKLKLLCTECHNAARAEEKQIRSDIKFDENGNMIH